NAKGLLTSSITNIVSSLLSSTSLIDSLSASAILNLLIAKGLSTKNSLSALLGDLSFFDVFKAMTPEELLTSLLKEGLITHGHDLASLKALLSGKATTSDEVLSELASNKD